MNPFALGISNQFLNSDFSNNVQSSFNHLNNINIVNGNDNNTNNTNNTNNNNNNNNEQFDVNFFNLKEIFNSP